MRSEEEMYDLILKIAQNDDRIRAVYMNGSRVNKNVPKDIFQDYDVVYVVSDTKPFLENEHWIDLFGERLYMQTPEKNDKLLGHDVDLKNIYGWLIQFSDGNRIDLHILSIEKAQIEIKADKLCRILLDKNNILPEIPLPTDEDYHIKKPVQEQFLCCANEFWWCLNNAAKGLWRKEIPYVQDQINLYIRPQLIKMLSWKIGINTDFSVSLGKSGKYMYKYLSPIEYNRFLETYAAGNIKDLWRAFEIMCSLFNDTALHVSEKLNYCYNKQEASASLRHLIHVKNLPANAKKIY